MISKINFVQAVVPKFDGYYDHRAMLMESFLQSKKYSRLIDEGIPKIAVGTMFGDAQKKQQNELQLKDLE